MIHYYIYRNENNGHQTDLHKFCSSREITHDEVNEILNSHREGPHGRLGMNFYSFLSLLNASGIEVWELKEEAFPVAEKHFYGICGNY